VTVITRVLVGAEDPAFGDPTKFIGPVHDRQRADALVAGRGWVVKPDGDYWRRVVPSHRAEADHPVGAIRRLVDGDLLVVCVGRLEAIPELIAGTGACRSTAGRPTSSSAPERDSAAVTRAR
jgi:carbamate kinase